MGVCLEANFLIFLLLTSSFIVRSPSKRQRESHKSETLKEVNEASPNNNDRLPYRKTETRVTRACDTSKPNSAVAAVILSCVVSTQRPQAGGVAQSASPRRSK